MRALFEQMVTEQLFTTGQNEKEVGRPARQLQ